MAIPTPVNGQITDAVTQTNLTVLGDSPAVAMSNLFQVSAQAFGLMMQNAVTAQQQTNITAQAATTQGVAMLYSLETSSGRLLRMDQANETDAAHNGSPQP